jgi:hypothetical protein
VESSSRGRDQRQRSVWGFLKERRAACTIDLGLPPMEAVCSPCLVIRLPLPLPGQSKGLGAGEHWPVDGWGMPRSPAPTGVPAADSPDVPSAISSILAGPVVRGFPLTSRLSLPQAASCFHAAPTASL